MKRLLALLIGGLGLRALIRRRTPAVEGASPVEELRAKLDATKAPEPELEPSSDVGSRRADVHARARKALDDLKE